MYALDVVAPCRIKMPLRAEFFRQPAPRKPYWSDGACLASAASFPALKPLVRLSEATFLPPREGAFLGGKCKVRARMDFLDESGRMMKKVTFILYATYQGRTCLLFHSVDAEERGGIAEAEMTLYPPPFYAGDGGSIAYFFKAVHRRGEKDVESERLILS
jgi:hypothetical protein